MTTDDRAGLEALAFAMDDLVDGDPGLQFNVAGSTPELLDELGRRLAGLGQRARGWRVVPESLGWLALWNRTVAVADANHAACHGGSSYGLQVLWRAAFEIQYHLLVISDPGRIRWPEGSDDEVPESAMTANDRLCAYVAYGLSNDARQFGLLTQSWLLRALWDEGDEPPSAEQQVFRKLAQHVLGEEEQAAGDSRSARSQNRRWANAQKKRIDAWLEHPRLARWATVIKGINGGRGPGTFYGVLNPRRDSLGQDTFRTPLAIATPEYSRVSSLFHGSTIEGFVEAQDGRIGAARAEAADIDRQARANIYVLMMCWLLLHSLAAQVDEVAL